MLEAALRPLGRRRHQPPPARASPTPSAGRTASTPASSAPATAPTRASSAASSPIVDSQDGPDPALAVLADPAIDVVTLTVTEKGYCHRPATGALDPTTPTSSTTSPTRGAAQPARPPRPRPRPAPQLARPPDHPRQLRQHPRQRRHPRRRRRARSPSGAAPASPTGSTANVAFPSTMVDRIVPATTPADLAAVERAYGYRDSAAVGRRAVPPVGDREPLRRPRAALGPRRRAPSSTTSPRSSS